MSNNPEIINQGPEKEQSREVEQAAAERLEKLREKHEKVGELTKETEEKLDNVRHEIESLKVETEKTPESDRQATPERRTSGPIRKADRDASFNATMQEVRTQLSAPSRTFSKVIHNKTVEKASEALGGTVARPNALLSGAVFAFIVTLSVYLIAKNLGYPLSGFESIGAFVLGWVIGIAYDFLKVMITGRQ
jgi:hypothetical protein